MVGLKIGLIGLDTSHAKVFTRILNDLSFEHHIPGLGKVVAGFPGGSPDFKASISRVEGYTKELKENYGVSIVESPESAAEQADAVMITSVDGRVHLAQFERIARFRKPVFIDKPFAVSHADAKKMVTLAEEKQIPLMSSSVRRYAEGLAAALGDDSKGAVTGAECYGPIEFVPSQPGWYWYGIHTVEVLFSIMGKGCSAVKAYSDGGQEVIVGKWNDGRVGIARGNRHPNISHGALIHRESGSQFVDSATDGLKKYAHLLETAVHMFRTGQPGVDPLETLEIIRFIEAANESRESGQIVSM
jgi:hypothetical protein